MCAPLQYLEITFLENNSKAQSFSNYTSTCRTILPFANSKLYFAPVTNAKLLTKGEDVKAAFKLCLNIEGIEHTFNPGDTIGIIPNNNENEVTKLLQLLELEKVADLSYKLSILKNSKKKNAAIPKHIPQEGTIRNIFTNYLDIRGPLKKSFLLTLSEYATTVEDREKLNFLCSPAGSDEYIKLVTGHGKTLTELLEIFPSCKPPVVRLLEHLPAIKPRPYSISSSPLVPEELSITFTVVSFSSGLKGLCSGWLENIATHHISSKTEMSSNVAQELQKVPLYFRKSNQFSLPADPTIPIVMVGCGTGIAPYFGFLQHRDLLVKSNNIALGKAWLFFGCRYSERDFLYKDEIQDFLKSGALEQLHCAFSRENAVKVYIQHVLEQKGDELMDMILNCNAVMYVCGDAKNMVKNVRAAVVDILVKYASYDNKSAENFILQLEKSGRYIEDTWL